MVKMFGKMMVQSYVNSHYMIMHDCLAMVTIFHTVHPYNTTLLQMFLCFVKPSVEYGSVVCIRRQASAVEASIVVGAKRFWAGHHWLSTYSVHSLCRVDEDTPIFKSPQTF